MEINASLFALIQNDAFLKGTRGLEGHSFARTITYLQQYFEHLKAQGTPIPANYLALINSFDFLLEVESRLNALTSNNQETELQAITETIKDEVMGLSAGEIVLIPGGWSNNDGGHAMLYQISRDSDGCFFFSVINAGAGGDFHQANDSHLRDRFNPNKRWQIESLESSKQQVELQHFFKRLLQFRKPSRLQSRQRPMDANRLYQRIIESISHLGGSLQDANLDLKEHVYTSGQLGGSCPERVLHQQLKLRADSEDAYLSFIFKFKHYALLDYFSRCEQGLEPFNEAVCAQILIAIENNLRILERVEEFDLDTFTSYLNELESLKERVSSIPITTTTKPTKRAIHSHPEIIIPHQFISFQEKDNNLKGESLPTSMTPLSGGANLLSELSEASASIKNLEELQALLSMLPLSEGYTFNHPFYSALSSETHYKQFLALLEQLIELFHRDHLRETQTPTTSITSLKLATLLSDTERAITTRKMVTEKRKLPCFQPFAESIIASFIQNQSRNPFYASHHPGSDQDFINLQKRFKTTPFKTRQTEYNEFYNALLDLAPSKKRELEQLYEQQFARSTEERHLYIKENRLEALYMLLVEVAPRDPHFADIRALIEKQIHYEKSLIKLINPHLKYPRSLFDGLSFEKINEKHCLHSALLATWLPYQPQASTLQENKYQIKKGAAAFALLCDAQNRCPYESLHLAKSDNDIQLCKALPNFVHSAELQVSQEDIEARNFFILRRAPSLQIPLTLDFFTRRIDLLNCFETHRYLEANLFQPGLLLNDAIKGSSYLKQFDTLLKKGLRYYAPNGELNKQCLPFIRLNHRLSRYLALHSNDDAKRRLKTNRQELIKRLTLSSDPEVRYALEETLFLTLMTELELGESLTELLPQALSSMFYLNSHTNPNPQDDVSEKNHFENALRAFKAMVARVPPKTIEQTLSKLLSPHTVRSGSPQTPLTFDVYSENGNLLHQADALNGLILKDGMAERGLALALQTHPLLLELGLGGLSQCLSDKSGHYLRVTAESESYELSWKKKTLSVKRTFEIDGNREFYQLIPLSNRHQAKKANSGLNCVKTSLPKPLLDGSMNLWQRSNLKTCAVLSKNNQARYKLEGSNLILLDSDGNKTPYRLVTSNHEILSEFESTEFTLTHQGADRQRVELPRYNLCFEQLSKGTALTLVSTGETLIERPASIDKAIAGITLCKNDHQRFLVPVSRFYAIDESNDSHNYYQVVHDIDGTIAEQTVENHWQSKRHVHKPLWLFDGSEKTISFQLKDGELIADSPADALYLAYLYLASNQTEKAWQTLEDCKTRLGGLTGKKEELCFIRWICKELPHQLPDGPKKAGRATPPYVSCQLKAASLICDFLESGEHFEKTPEPASFQTKNDHYQGLCQKEQECFLNDLPSFIYQHYSRLQKMTRHLEATYTLDPFERRHLLDFYHSKQPSEQSALGALGHAWRELSKDALEKEYRALNAQFNSSQEMPRAAQKRLKHLEKELSALATVQKRESALELVPINLSLTKLSLNQGAYSEETKRHLESWYHQNGLPGPEASKERQDSVIQALTSETTESEFIKHFPIYFQVACLGSPESTSELRRFCRATLIASRHIPAKEQDSDIPFLCNLLYRVLCNQEAFIQSSRKKSPPAAKMSEGSPSGKKKKTVLYKVGRFFQKRFSQEESATAEETSKDREHKSSNIGELSFQELVTKCQALPTTPIELYQAKNIYSELLATAAQLKTQKLHLQLPSVHIAKECREREKGLKENATSSENLKTLRELMEAFRVIEQEKTAELSYLSERLQTLNTEQRSWQDKSAEAQNIEQQAGIVLFSSEKNTQELATNFLKNPSFSQEIIEQAALDKDRLFVNSNLAWQDALTLANLGPSDERSAQTWRLHRLSKRQSKITKANLLSLYCQGSLTDIMAKTSLNQEGAKRLNDLIHRALVEGVLAETASKVFEKLRKAQCENDVYLATEALELLSRDVTESLDSPTLTIIQHQEKIVLRPQQTTALKNLLKEGDDGKPFKESVEKVIMGGGKSKVILPVLAEQKAKGHNLVVIEVPEELLHTNYVDLNRSSQRLFGKKAYRFQFDRDSDCSPESLKKIYHRFSEVMSSKSYLVTTGPSIQSLELKYIELLLQESDKGARWQEQIYWLDRLTNLFREDADCLIDEAHQGLSIKKRLNYTSGESRSISPALIKSATSFFRLIDRDFIEHATQLDLDYDWEQFEQELARLSLTDLRSPLYLFYRNAQLRMGDGVLQALIDYLTDKADSIPTVVENASLEEKETLAFIKQEVSVLLSQTLSRKLDVNYGASRLDELSEVERTLAIPYSASNQPSEKSRFGNELEAINYTAQMMLIQGLSRELIADKLVSWQTLASQELLKDEELTSLDETPTALGFSVISGGLKLSEVDASNEVQLDSLHHKLAHDPNLIFDLLEEQSFKQIKQDSAILHSDSFNHVDCYRSVQCLSGTPSNHSTFHQRLSFEHATALGNDGYLLELIRDKGVTLQAEDYQSLEPFLEHLLNHNQNAANTRAIIDISATFKDKKNVEVASAIANYLNAHQKAFNPPLKHVLYFNDAHVLSAIDLQKPESPIELGTSNEEEISRILGSSPNERFTYYDQVHTLGTDIQQGKEAHALVLVDEKQSLPGFLQGIMRMRGLNKQQSIELVVPKRIEGWDQEAFINQLISNEQRALLKDNLFAAKARMTNLIRRTLLTKVQALPSESSDEKARLTRAFSDFFETIPSLNLFHLYGALNKEQATRTLLQNFQSELLTTFRNLMRESGSVLSSDEDESVSQELERLKTSALNCCADTYQAESGDFSMAVETKKEIHKQSEISIASIDDCYSPDKHPEHFVSWQKTNIESFFANERTVSQKSTPLNHLFSRGNSLTPFSSNLHVSHNYAKTYQGQSDYLNAFLKPVFTIWYHLDANGALHAMIVTPTEAQELAEQFKSSPNHWLSSTSDTLLAGQRPAGILENSEYLSLREQVRFFNGELASLLHQETPLIWLENDAEQKINLYEQRLLAYRPESTQHFPQMKSALLESKVVGFNHIANAPFDDHRQTDWSSLFDALSPIENTHYQHLAEAFHYINQNWLTHSLDATSLISKFQLPIKSLSYLNAHLKTLAQLKSLLEFINKQSESLPLLAKLPKDQLQTLEGIIGISAQELSLQSPEPRDASVRALLLLRNHKALQDQAHQLDERLISSVKTLNNPDLLCQFLSLSNPPDALLLQVIARALKDNIYNPELISAIIKLPWAFSNEQLLSLVGKCTSREQLNKLFERSEDFTQETLAAILETDDLSKEHFYALLAHPNVSKKEIEKARDHSAFNDEVFCYLLKQPFLSLEVLTALAPHAKSASTVNLFFKRADLTYEMAEPLFSQEFGDFIIKDWPWLSPQQAMRTLEKTTDFDALSCALAHPCLSKLDHKSWLRSQKEKLANAKKQLQETNEPSLEEELIVLLADLRLKSVKLALKSQNNDSYAAAARTSFTLHQTLQASLGEYQKSDKSQQAKNQFFVQCKDSIDKARPILKKHRGYKQLFVDFFNVLATLFTAGHYYRKDPNNWRFFMVNTKSLEKVENVREALLPYKPPQ